mmetsp:Transcript_13805/g.39761  ORF Transcript_13805/g.39761 Transcript_13805/m.39761 type:complete len:211 (-) Transcript_13805:334-966(-)
MVVIPPVQATVEAVRVLEWHGVVGVVGRGEDHQAQVGGRWAVAEGRYEGRNEDVIRFPRFPLADGQKRPLAGVQPLGSKPPGRPLVLHLPRPLDECGDVLCVFIGDERCVPEGCVDGLGQHPDFGPLHPAIDELLGRPAGGHPHLVHPVKSVCPSIGQPVRLEHGTPDSHDPRVGVGILARRAHGRRLVQRRRPRTRLTVADDDGPLSLR